MLYEDYVSDNFPKLADLIVSQKCLLLPKMHLTFVLPSASQYECASVTRNEDMGFACAEIEVCGYRYGDAASVCICKGQYLYEGDFVLCIERVYALKFQYKSIQTLICCKALITSLRAALAD